MYSAPSKTMSDTGSGIERSAQAQEVEKRENKDTIPAKMKTAEGKKIGRNDPCFCGSGKKYKKCHGS